MDEPNLEQPAEEVVTTTPAEESVESILNEGLNSEESKLEDATQLEEDKVVEEPEIDPATGEPVVKEKEEALFTEIVVGEQKLAFKTEDEFKAFIENNPMLKDGFSMQSDYTKKTQDLAERNKEFEETKTKFDERWGVMKPNEDSVKSLQSAWQGFQVATDRQSQIIGSVLEDAGKISRGEKPTGILANLPTDPNNEQSPEVQKMREEQETMQNRLNRMEVERKAKESKDNADQEKRDKDEAFDNVNKWLKGMSEKGITVEDEEKQVMASFVGAKNPATEKAYTLDELYKLARMQLGKSGIDAKKEVIATTQDLKKKTGNRPSSDAPANANVESKDIGGILSEGIKELQGQ